MTSRVWDGAARRFRRRLADGSGPISIASPAPKPGRRTLRGIDAVVNASGALQTGARDRLADSQGRAITALIAACEAAGVRRFVQISAPGANPQASTAFMRTKAAADARLKASSLDWTILRPGLVIGRDAYGGTALIRALAAFPLIVPLVRPCGQIQTVAMDEVARLAAIAAAGEIGPRIDLDLVEARPHELREIVLAHRAWLGLAPPRAVAALPGRHGAAGRLARRRVRLAGLAIAAALDRAQGDARGCAGRSGDPPGRCSDGGSPAWTRRSPPLPAGAAGPESGPPVPAAAAGHCEPRHALARIGPDRAGADGCSPRQS